MEKIEVLGASHLATDNYEIQRVNNFEISVEGISTEDKKKTITLAVVSGFLPNESNEIISLNYGNTQVTVAGAARPNNSGTLVVRDFIEKDVEAIVDEWRSKVYNKENDAIGFAREYKKTAKVTQCAPDGTLLRVWDLSGVWPSAVDYGAVNNDSPGVKTISITLQYDKAKLNKKNRENFAHILG